MEGAYFRKLKELVEKSSLSAEDKTSLTELFSRGNESELENLLMLFMENPYWISVINDNYKSKKEAIESNNANLWQEIMKGEESQIGALGA